ncbi:MAG: hypothetical protein JWQ96_1885, partial [Segetibacter sp.]|nr:hypothetical protein [Segetibacter sp.]
MQRLSVPRYIQWIFLTALFFLLLMTLLRLSLVLSFNRSSDFKSLLPAFWLGFRFDLRIVSIVSFLVFLFGSIKPLHPLQKKYGRLVSFIIYTLFSIVFTIFYTVDFPHYSYVGQRLNGSILNYLDDAKITMGMVWQTYPVFILILVLFASIFILIAVVKFMYNYILSKPITASKRSRLGWSLVFFVLLAIGIFGRVGQFPLRWSDAFAIGKDYQSQVALNTFQSFFSSLSY